MIRADVHARFRALVARAIAKADQAEAEQLAKLRPSGAREPRRGRPRGGEISLGRRDG